jgi:hypothetical protein
MANKNSQNSAASARDNAAADTRKRWQQPKLNRLDASYANANPAFTVDGGVQS